MNKRFAAWLPSVALFQVCSLLAVLPRVTAQDVEIVAAELAAELGGVSVVSIPQPSPLPGFLATKVVLRSSPGTQLVTFENIAVDGPLVQQGISPVGALYTTPFVDNEFGSLWAFIPVEWRLVDSHINISPDMVAGGAGRLRSSIYEANHGSNPNDIRSQLPWDPTVPVSGIGRIVMAAETDPFSLLPEFQTNEIDFAYLVTPDDSTVAAGEVFLTVGVLGEGIINSGEPGGASFGFNGNDPVVIPFIPEPATAVLAMFALAAITCLRRRTKTLHPALAVAVIASLSVSSNRAVADTFGSGANAFEIEFVTIGDPGNLDDTVNDRNGDPTPMGAVDHGYRIGKYEISRDMIEKANTEGDLGITLWDMTSFGGNRPNRPATGVSWNEAARFVNWLNTSQDFQSAYKFAAQPGDTGYNPNQNISLWLPGDVGYAAANRFRNSQAQYFLPSAHEWYKAAYYDPSANGGAGGYWNYTTGRDMAPTAVASGTGPDTAVYQQAFEQGPTDITQAGGLSPYGVMGLGGNVYEWEETELDLLNNDGSSLRGVRGGVWSLSSIYLYACVRPGADPTFGNFSIGFRVASIPEPSSLLLGVIALAAVTCLRRRTDLRNPFHGNQ